MKLSAQPAFVILEEEVDNSFNFFKKIPVLSYVFTSRRSVYILKEDVSYQTEYKGLKLKVSVPEGMKTDLASIPVPISWFLRPNEPELVVASLIHDYLRTKKSFVEIEGKKIELSKIEASIIFWKVLLEQGNSKIKSAILALATLFGKKEKE